MSANGLSMEDEFSDQRPLGVLMLTFATPSGTTETKLEYVMHLKSKIDVYGVVFHLELHQIEEGAIFSEVVGLGDPKLIRAPLLAQNVEKLHEIQEALRRNANDLESEQDIGRIGTLYLEQKTLKKHEAEFKSYQPPAQLFVKDQVVSHLLEAGKKACIPFFGRPQPPVIVAEWIPVNIRGMVSLLERQWNCIDDNAQAKPISQKLAWHEWGVVENFSVYLPCTVSLLAKAYRIDRCGHSISKDAYRMAWVPHTTVKIDVVFAEDAKVNTCSISTTQIQDGSPSNTCSSLKRNQRFNFCMTIQWHQMGSSYETTKLQGGATLPVYEEEAYAGAGTNFRIPSICLTVVCPNKYKFGKAAFDPKQVVHITNVDLCSITSSLKEYNSGITKDPKFDKFCQEGNARQYLRPDINISIPDITNDSELIDFCKEGLNKFHKR